MISCVNSDTRANSRFSLHRLWLDLSNTISLASGWHRGLDGRVSAGAPEYVIKESANVVAGCEATDRRAPSLNGCRSRCLAEEMRDVLVDRYSSVEQVLVTDA